MNGRFGASSVLAIILIACSTQDDGDGSAADGKNALVDISTEPPGAACAAGGSRVRGGVDANGDGRLDDAEVTSTSFVCSGANGLAGPLGADGQNGPKGEPGQDGQDGQDGQNGQNGQNGQDGQDGADGANGQDGLDSLVNVTDEPMGVNCMFGGKKIETGLDDDRNGTLEAGEVDATSYLCNTSGCTGKRYRSHCWHLAAPGQSCTAVCATRGGYSEGTRTIAGDLGTDADCGAVLGLFGFTGPVTVGSSHALGGVGCLRSGGFGNFRSTAPATTADATASDQRVCACEY